MLNSLQLTNFKGWSDTGRLRLAPITGLFGANSSGKTSIIQSLLLLKQTSESPDRARVFDLGDENSYVSLGTFSDVQYRHSNRNPVGIEVTWSRLGDPVTLEDPVRREPILRSSELGYAVEVDLVRERDPAVREMTYWLGEASFTMRRKPRSVDAYTLSAAQANGFRLRRVTGRAWDLPHPVRCYGFPDQVRAYFRNANFLSDLELAFEEQLATIYYLGPLREDPHRRYEWAGGRPSDVGQRGQNAIEALIASRLDGKINNRGWVHRSDGTRRRPQVTKEEQVALWLQELGLVHSFRVTPIDPEETIYRVLVKLTASSAEVSLPDVGFGVSQVLPVLALLAYVPEGSTVLLEQPEIHLHPSVQSRLADAVIETALARNVQVIVESHSEHFLLRLQRRIAECELDRGIFLKPADVALYFCSTSRGAAVATELDVDMFGNIRNWPTDFFGDALEETVRMSEAGLQRQVALADT